MSKKPLRDTQRFDYKIYNRTGKKVDKTTAKLEKLSGKLERELVMESNQLVDDECKISRDILRFWNEYDMAELEDIDDIREGISELKNLMKKFEDKHVELQRSLGEDEYGDKYQNYNADVKKMMDWIKISRKEISERKRKHEESLENKEKDGKIKEINETIIKEKKQAKTEEKYLNIKIEQFLVSIDLEGTEETEIIERALITLNEMLDKYTDLHKRLENLFGDGYDMEFGDEFKTKTDCLSKQIITGSKRIKFIKEEKKSNAEKLEKAGAKEKYDEKVMYSKYLLEEVVSRSGYLKEVYEESLEYLSDDQLLERKNKIVQVDSENNLIMERIADLVKEVPSQFNVENNVLKRVEKIRDELRDAKKTYQLKLENQVLDRDLTAKKLQSTYALNIELPKFTGYDSAVDIYTFQSDFEKLVSPNVRKNLLTDYLKKNYLDGLALSLVKETQDLGKIWMQLKESFGCTMLLLQKKLSEVKKCGPLWKIKDKEKLIEALSMLLNGMAELTTMAEKHDIKDQLYHHSYIGLIFDLMGNNRREKFIFKNVDKKLKCEDKWMKLMEFLENEMKALKDIVLIEKSKQYQTRDEERKSTKENKSYHESHESNNVNHQLKPICTICGKDDHVTSVTQRGKVLVHYFSCEKFVRMNPSERFQELMNKNLCFQCLYPGAKKDHEGTCFNQFACKHSSHTKYNKVKHVMVCHEHANESKNKELFEKYMKKFITNSKVEHKNFTKNMKLSFYSDTYLANVEDETVENSIFMLQTIQVEGKSFNVFYDTGCGDIVSRKGAVDELEKMGRARNIVPGPIVLTGVGDNKSVCDHGAYQVRLPLHNGNDVNMSGLCLDKVTSTFPTYHLQEVEKDIHKEYQKSGKNPRRLPKLPRSVGGTTDLMIGIQYLKYFPKEKYELPNGLKIFEAAFVSVDGSRGVIGGPHRVFTELKKQINWTYWTAESYFSEILKVYRNGYQVNLDIPLLGCKKYDDVVVDTPVVEIKRKEEDIQCTLFHSKSSVSLLEHKFQKIENAGTYPSYQCKRCQECVSCLVAYSKRSYLKLEKKFETSEDAGTDVSYRCIQCRDCSMCKQNERIECTSIQEEMEQNIIDKSVKVDLVKCETIAKLPFIKDPTQKLSENEHIALKVFKSQARKLKTCEEDRDEVIKSEQKLQQLGFVDYFENLTMEQKCLILNSLIRHFIPWRAVWNPNSLSTPCRLVFDASMKTNSEYSLNDLLPKGRNNMNKLVEIVLRWSIHRYAYHTDVQKMYNTIKLEAEYWCYQLYLWNEDLDPESRPTWKVIKTLIYGVTPSGNQAERGLRQTAELQKDQYPRENEVVQKDIYVDDCISGESTLQKIYETTDNLKLVLNKGGFTLKGFTFSGSHPPNNLSDDGISVNVAGLKWYSKDDQLSLNIGKLNFAKRKRGKKPTNGEGVIPEEFTKRECVGKAAEFFDLVGKITPITAGWKLDLHELTRRKLDWDDKIPSDLMEVWRSNFETMEQMGQIRFKRAIVPHDAVNLDIETIDTADASRSIICVAIYARFKRKNGEYSCHLVFSRSKIVPENTTMPRAELLAAVLNARTGHVVQRSFGIHFKGCIKLTDSQIVLHWINNDKLALKQWLRNRILEIRRLTSTNNWKYVSTANMIADLGTRKGAKIQDISEDSVWMNGYPWMRLEVDNFPVTTVAELKLNFEEKKQHDQECLAPEISSEWNNNLCLYLQNDSDGVKIVPDELVERYRFSKYIIDPNRFRFRKVIRVLAIVIIFVEKLLKRKGKKLKSLDHSSIKIPSIFVSKHDQYLCTEGMENGGTSSYFQCKNGMIVNLTDRYLQLALTYFYRKSTEEVKKYLDRKRYQNITSEIDGILYYTGRILPSQTFNGKLNLSDVSLDLTSASFCVPITDSASPLAYSIVNETHWYNNDAKHSGVETLLRYTQRIAFIIGGRGLVKKFRNECVMCRLLAKKAIEVAMGPIHQSNLNIAPPFFMSQVDLFGPVNSYSNANKRATVKLWFVVFCCCTTGAIDVKTMEDYSTESFILGFMRFACKFGYPKMLLPDEGSQLVKGCKIMKLEFFDLKHKLHEQFGVEFETCPAGAHYMHGKVERKIKHVQESFLKVTHNCRLSILQWETLADQVANSVNNQPIAVGNIVEDVENLDILTPNRLILGRNNERCPTGDLIVTNDPRKILKANSEIFSTWFECWLVSYVPTLVHQPKWFRSDRDTKVGDVVLFLKSDKEFDKQYKYGLVKDVKISKDGKIRKIDIEYQNHNESVKRCTNRGSRDVVVIHPIDEMGILFELGAIAKSTGY